MFSSFSTVFFVYLLSHTVLGANTSIPLCTNSSAPPNILSNPPCLCTPSANPPGCTVVPCRQGEDACGAYLCECNEEFQPECCVFLRCDDGTTAFAPYNQSNPYPESSYSSTNFLSSYSYPSPSYSTNSSRYALNNNFCGCEKNLPADCLWYSPDPPISSGPPCACNMDMWLTGCTLKPCQDGDKGDFFYVCECTPFNSPDFCRMPRCSR